MSFIVLTFRHCFFFVEVLINKSGMDICYKTKISMHHLHVLQKYASMMDKFAQMDLKLWWTEYLFAWTINNCLWYNLIYAFHCITEKIWDPWYYHFNCSGLEAIIRHWQWIGCSIRPYMSSWWSWKEGDLPLCILTKREIKRNHSATLISSINIQIPAEILKMRYPSL